MKFLQINNANEIFNEHVYSHTGVFFCFKLILVGNKSIYLFCCCLLFVNYIHCAFELSRFVEKKKICLFYLSIIIILSYLYTSYVYYFFFYKNAFPQFFSPENFIF